MLISTSNLLPLVAGRSWRSAVYVSVIRKTCVDILAPNKKYTWMSEWIGRDTLKDLLLRTCYLCIVVAVTYGLLCVFLFKNCNLFNSLSLYDRTVLFIGVTASTLGGHYFFEWKVREWARENRFIILSKQVCPPAMLLKYPSCIFGNKLVVELQNTNGEKVKGILNLGYSPGSNVRFSQCKNV